MVLIHGNVAILQGNSMAAVTRTIPRKERSGRVIDEEKLIEEIDYYIKEAGWGEEANKVLGWCKEFIDNQPKVGEWILCSERLPEKHIDVLVSFNDCGCIMAWYSEVNKCWKSSITDNVITSKVTAWQQLPEPYRKDGII